jgi:hypothetical protein
MTFLASHFACDRRQNHQKPPATGAVAVTGPSAAKLDRLVASFNELANDNRLPEELRNDHRQAAQALRRDGWGWVTAEPRVITAAIMNNGFVQIDHLHTLILSAAVAPTSVRLLRKDANGKFIELAKASTERAVRRGVGTAWGLTDLQTGILVAAFHVKPDFDTTGMMEEKFDENETDLFPLATPVTERQNIYVDVQFANGQTTRPHHVRIDDLAARTSPKLEK